MKKLFMLLFAISLFSCSKETIENEQQETPEIPETPAIPETPTPPEPLIPLTMGNTWVYDAISYAPDGRIWYRDTVSIIINEKKIIDGKEFFGIGGFFIRNVDSVTIERAYEDSTAIYFKKVNTNEELFTFQFGSDCKTTNTYTAYSEPKSIYGYDCFLNEQVGLTCDNKPVVIIQNYLKPGLGFVGFAGYYSNPDGSTYLSSEQRLISYTLK